ncbi:MAG: prepilin-type N-terminal cleavage/methylation domain-containing protein [bacterium]
MTVKLKRLIMPNAENCIRKTKGFTMIELMVVVAIIGIIMVIAIPNFARMQSQARIRAGAQEIAQDFRQIRERSLGLSGSFTITIPDSLHYQVRHPDGHVTLYRLGSTTGGNLYFGASTAVGTPPEATVPMIPGNGWDFSGLGGDLLFQSRGSATKGVAYITNGQEDFAVGVNPLGKIQVYKFENGLWADK